VVDQAKRRIEEQIAFPALARFGRNTNPGEQKPDVYHMWRFFKSFWQLFGDFDKQLESGHCFGAKWDEIAYCQYSYTSLAYRFLVGAASLQVDGDTILKPKYWLDMDISCFPFGAAVLQRNLSLWTEVRFDDPEERNRFPWLVEDCSSVSTASVVNKPTGWLCLSNLWGVRRGCLASVFTYADLATHLPKSNSVAFSYNQLYLFDRPEGNALLDVVNETISNMLENLLRQMQEGAML